MENWVKRALQQSPHHKGVALSGGVVAVVLACLVIAVVAMAHGTTQKRASARVTASIQLTRADVRRGEIVRGEVLFHNPTSRAKVVLHGCSTDGLYAIGFRAANGYLDQPAFSLVGCDEDLPSNELIAKPGTTAFQFRARAIYAGCAGGPELGPKYSAGWSPPCLKGPDGKRDVIPPLPAGTYSAVFVPETAHGPYVAPARLLVTKKP